MLVKILVERLLAGLEVVITGQDLLDAAQHCRLRARASRAGRLFVYRRLVDLLDRRLELGVELFVGLVFRQSFEKRAREAGDEGGIAGEPSAGLVTAVAARQGDDAQDARIRRQVAVQAGPGRDGDL